MLRLTSRNKLVAVVVIYYTVTACVYFAS